MKKLTVDQFPEVRVRVSTSPLLNVWKFFGYLRKKHRTVQKQTFRQVSEMFENFRKSSEIFGKCSRRLSSILKKFYEIFGNCRKSSEIFGSLLKRLENVGKFSKRSSDTFWKFSEIFGSVRKCSEMLGNPWKIFECIRRFMKIFNTIPISDICGLKIRFKDFDL